MHSYRNETRLSWCQTVEFYEGMAWFSLLIKQTHESEILKDRRKRRSRHATESIKVVDIQVTQRLLLN